MSTPQPLFRGGGEAKHKYQKTSNEKLYILENNIPEHHLVLENSLNFAPIDVVVRTTFLCFYFNFILVDFPEHLHESLKDKIPLTLFCLLKGCCISQ
jgi:hypothetical protein